jgi:predicted lysophospholipase L1 biosynthesis ABC-type transport system permease subunit
MNIGALHWAFFAVGAIVGVIVGMGVMSWCAMSSDREQASRIDALRVALGDVDRANRAHKIASTDADSIRTGRELDEAWSRAREVLTTT